MEKVLSLTTYQRKANEDISGISFVKGEEEKIFYKYFGWSEFSESLKLYWHKLVDERIIQLPEEEKKHWVGKNKGPFY